MQPGLIGALGLIAILPTILHVIATEVGIGTEVAKTPDAGALVLGSQVIQLVVMGKKVRAIAYFTSSKRHEMGTYLNILINIVS